MINYKNLATLVIVIIWGYFSWLLWQFMWNHEVITNYWTTLVEASLLELLDSGWWLCLGGMARNWEYM